MNKFLSLAFGVLLLFSCTSSQKLQHFSNSNLIFGSGGGITGATNTYILHYDGAIEKTNSLTNETTQITQISGKKSKSFFSQFLNDGLDTLTFSVPGNMSYFIGFENDSVTHKVIWDGNTNPPAEAKAYYESLIQLINNQ